MKINRTDSKSRLRHKLFVTFFLITACVMTDANAQEDRNGKSAQPAMPALAPKVISIWPGVAPGSEQWKQKETMIHFGSMESIVNVTTPTLTAYLPDPAKATGTAVIIAPGGGFIFLGTDTHEIAEWLAARGITGIVLKYRTSPLEGESEAQLGDAGRARFGAQLNNHALITEDAKNAIADGIQSIKVVREHAAEWGISPNRIVFMGFSAGGSIAEFASVQPDLSARPNYAAPIYGAPFPVPAIPKEGVPPSLWKWRRTTISPALRSSPFTMHSRSLGTNRNFIFMNMAVTAGACASKAQRAITGSTSSIGGWKRTD